MRWHARLLCESNDAVEVLLPTVRGTRAAHGHAHLDGAAGALVRVACLALVLLHRDGMQLLHRHVVGSGRLAPFHV